MASLQPQRYYIFKMNEGVYVVLRQRNEALCLMKENLFDCLSPGEPEKAFMKSVPHNY